MNFTDKVRGLLAYDTPTGAGINGLAQGLLAAGAASQRPINNSEAMGMAMQGFNQGYQGKRAEQMAIAKMIAEQQAARNKAMIDQAKLGADQQKAGIDNEKLLQSYRNELKGDVQSFNDITGAYDSLYNSLTGNSSKAKDLAAIFNFAKALDPGSVVREGEQQMIVGTGSVFDTLRNYVSALQGEGNLQPEQRKALLDAAFGSTSAKLQGIGSRFDTFANNVVVPFFGQDYVSRVIPDKRMLNTDEILSQYRQGIDNFTVPKGSSTQPGRQRITATQRGQELEAQGLSDAQISETLRKEGYL